MPVAVGDNRKEGGTGMKISELVADLLNVKNEYGDIECLNQSMKDILLKNTLNLRLLLKTILKISKLSICA